MTASADAPAVGSGEDLLLREPWTDLARQRSAGKFGIWLFLASEILFFGALILTYSYYRYLFPDGFRAAGRETSVLYGTLNTAILLTSSLTVAVASQISGEAQNERLDERAHRLVSLMLAATVSLGLAFLVVKGFEYAEDLGKHLWPGASFALGERGAAIFYALYWLITGVHAIHLSIGIVVMSRLLLIGLRGRRPYAGNPELQVSTLYWHLVDVVWIFLYPLIYLPGREAT